MRVRQRDLDGQIALRGPDVDVGAVVLPREGARDRHVRPVTDGAHRGEELLQPRRIGVEFLEQTGPSRLDLVLRLSGAQRVGELGPERVQPGVRHLQDAADVRRLLPIEEHFRLGRVAVAVALASEESKRHQRVEKVARRATVQPQPSAERVEMLGTLRQLGKDAHFDGAQERLGRPEGKAGLQDLFG